MPKRETPLVTGQFYHVINRGVNSAPIFSRKMDYLRMIRIINFYRFADPGIKFSLYHKFSKARKKDFLEELEKEGKIWVRISCFCLMPNHFHFLLKQERENGIMEFMRLVQNSHARYYNTFYERTGPLFQGKYKVVRVVNEEQFVHVGRYIHLNPYSSYVVKELGDLENYPWSSLADYLGKEKHRFIDKEVINSIFTGPEDYQKFVFSQADYQRKLQKIKHLLLE